MNQSEIEQAALCRKYGAAFVPAPSFLKIGIADDVKLGMLPINGLRHPPRGDTTGWYICAGGEPADDSNYFKPLHLPHLDEWCGGLVKFIGLAPGWRFLWGPSQEDVWFDETLLLVS